MDEQVELFLQHLAEERGLSVNTTAAYRTDLEQFGAFVRERGLADWNAVTHDDLLAFLLFLRERRYANSTVARRTAAVKSFYAYLTSEGLVPGDPTEQILDVIDQDADIAMLVLAANPGPEGPGPLISGVP